MIENYINQVVKHLPFKMRSEVSEELKVQIDEMLGEDLSESNIEKVLLELGDPIFLAQTYQDEQYLISPRYFGKYKELMALVMKISLPIIFTFTLLESVFNPPSEDAIMSIIFVIFNSLIAVAGALITIFSIVTIIFAIIEYTKKDIDLFPFDIKSLKVKPTKTNEKNQYKVEGIITIIGVIFLGTLLFIPHVIASYDMSGPKPILIETLFNLPVFYTLVPVFALYLALAFVNAIVKLAIRELNVWTYSLEVLSQVALIVTVLIAMYTPNLINTEFFPSLINPVSGKQNAHAISKALGTAFNSIPLIIIVITLIEIAVDTYKFAKK